MITLRFTTDSDGSLTIVYRSQFTAITNKKGML